MGGVGIVCDSTCDLGPEWFDAHDVTMVPLKVHFGEETYRDWVDLTPEGFYDKLISAKDLPKTSQPSPADFSAVYSRLAEEGVGDIVSIHLTAALSGTCESAHLAAEQATVPVRVVDTKVVTQATGLVLKAAIAVRDSGGSAAAVEKAALDATAGVRMFFILNTLDYLVKGGRAGKAAGLAAAVLRIKPVLTFNTEGTIEPFKKVKGLKKAMTALAAHVANESRSERMRVVVFYTTAPEIADQMRVALDASGADFEFDSIGRVGSVIGTYAGPGAVGVAYLPLA